MIGRAPSFSSSSKPAPYSVPGVARPPPQRQPPAQQQLNLQALPSQRAVVRGQWATRFGGRESFVSLSSLPPPTVLISLVSIAAFLEPGPTNRLVLSVRSGVPAEVDFGLERLVQVSSTDPGLLLFVELPGLLDGLVGVIRDYLERRKADWDSGVPSLGFATGQEPREAVQRGQQKRRSSSATSHSSSRTRSWYWRASG
jgi:hypothetical protein